ncbi:MAG: lysoplasmalogenase [Blastocatellia bacterium]|nr:lysoplasmalogenase [Blastocatellia bacterium]
MSLDALTFGRLRGFGSVEWRLLLLSISASIIYFLTKSVQPFPGSIVLKALGMAPLAVLAFRVLREGPAMRGKELLRDRDNTILAMALTFSCLGDILLDRDPSGLFVQGLLAFLVAHLIYILLFVRNFHRPLRPSGGQMALIALVLLYSLLLSNWFAPSLGSFARPVMIYVCTITVMVISAILAGFSRPWIVAGTLLFLISDSIIAINRFKLPVPMRDYLVWGTYYLGQYGIAIGFFREKLGDGSTR